MKHFSPLLPAVLAVMFAQAATANPDAVVLDARLIPGWTTDQGTQMAALSLTLAPGWKTYWRAPGEAGIPPAFDWNRSENLASVAIHWPTPQVFHTAGMRSIGYHDGLLLPIEVRPENPARPVTLRASVDIGVCKDICVPALLEVEVTLTAPGVGDPAIKAALRAHPLSAYAAGVSHTACAVKPTDDGLRVTAAITMPELGADETVVIEPGLPGVWASDTAAMRAGGTLTAATELVGQPGQPIALDRSKIVLTVLGGAQAVEIKGCPAE